MRTSDLLFLAVLTSVPIQLGKFFFLDTSYVLGIPIDYRALTLYLSDMIVLAYLATFLLENLHNLKGLYTQRKHFIITLTIFNFFLIISALFFSSSKLISIWQAVKFSQFSLLAIFASISFAKKTVTHYLPLVLVVSLVWQSALIIFQAVLGHSLGLSFLGERSFDSSTPNIAHASLFGNQILRPYGTFSHPNVAASFLLIYLLLLLEKAQLKFLLIKIFTLIALFLTFSKAAIVGLIFSLIVFYQSKILLTLFFVAGTIALVFLIRVIPDSQLATIAERLILAQAALDIALINPLFGVGSGNFILALSQLNLFSLAQIRLLQPVHNVFLLILAENGAIGLALFALLLFVALKSASTNTKIALALALLVFASLDHFFWTLQQGRLLFFLIVGYLASSPKKARN